MRVLVGEMYRYQVVGPPHFGLTNLRTIQDWVLLRTYNSAPAAITPATTIAALSRQVELGVGAPVWPRKETAAPKRRSRDQELDDEIPF